MYGYQHCTWGAKQFVADQRKLKNESQRFSWEREGRVEEATAAGWTPLVTMRVACGLYVGVAHLTPFTIFAWPLHLARWECRLRGRNSEASRMMPFETLLQDW